MGILAEPLHFLEKLKLPAGYSVCELGNQYITCQSPHVLAMEWHQARGCGRYVSIDGNGRGTVCFDLNRKLKGEIKKPFDLVTDFGTGEHIFDQAQVWRTVHALTKPGGYIVFDRPSQGYRGHCFYRTDLCTFQDIADANGYTILRLEEASTVRGELIRGVFRRGPWPEVKFRIPQQGRYRKALQIPC